MEETKEAFRMAREVGFTNINMDLIVGRPGEDIEDVRGTLEKLKETINQDYESFGHYFMDHGYINKFSSDECVKSVSEFTECNVDSNTLYDYIISIDMDIKKHSKKSFFKRFKRYKFRLLPKEMYMDLMNKCVDYILGNLK